jgi:hypothetical protein
MWKPGQSGNPQGRRIKVDEPLLPGETKADQAKRRARERSAAWRKANPERVKELAAQSYARSKEHWEERLAAGREQYRRNADKIIARQRASREKNPELHRERVRRHYRENKAKFPAYVAARKARKLRATPPWADMGAIAAVYEEAHRITVETGVPHEVDHIHPLQGEHLCGLHVHWNLQILTRTENRKKAASVPA